MAPNPRVAKAFRAMKVLDVTEETVKPVLKNLLKLYQKNWNFIEEDNYRALVEAIFEKEESKVVQPKKKNQNADAQATETKKKRRKADPEEAKDKADGHEQPDRPLKRLCLRYQEDCISSSGSNPRLCMNSKNLKRKKEEHFHSLLKPKVEHPSDGLSLEVSIPGSVSLCTEQVLGGNNLIRDAEVPKTPLFNSVNVKERNNGAKIIVDSSSELEIASIASGKVKISQVPIFSINDISKGQESVVISLVNEVNNDQPPTFHYIPSNIKFENANFSCSLARMGDSCCSACIGDCVSNPCACGYGTSRIAYTIGGLVKEDFLEECMSMNRGSRKHSLSYCKGCPLERSKEEDAKEGCKGHLVRKFIKECWWKCGCNGRCGNRVVQRGIKRNLQVFMTPQGKGWGLRTLEDLPQGAFVCEFVGEILTTKELYFRISESSSKHEVPVLLDADWSARAINDDEALCLDAMYYGNVARFINHRCFDANLIGIPVEVETHEHHYYRFAFFTTKKVDALEELTRDYGIDFNDHGNEFKTFECLCESKFCRNLRRMTRSRSGKRRR